jgi:hypothetical protein
MCFLILGAFLYKSLILTIVAMAFVALFFVHYLSRESFVEFQDDKVKELHDRLASVFPESRHIKMSGSNESFTLNKQHIYLCIKDEHGNYYDDNSLMYVLLHEYAHVLCDEVDEEDNHKPKFRRIFAELIDKAARAGIYDPSSPMVANYCGYGNHKN